jgi:hypothetical protein
VLAALGVGFFVAGSTVAVNFNRISDWDVNGFRVAGSIFLSLGIGFLLSAVSSFVLAKSLGVLKANDATRLD